MSAVERLQEKFPEEIIEVGESAGQTYVIVKRERILDILKFLHDAGDLLFDHLADLTAVDWYKKKTPRFEVVYNLYSIRYKEFLRIKAQVPEEDPRITSVTSIWKVANWFEREVYDMFGIVFEGHPDLRRLLMPEDWEGFPLRKDYPLFLKPEEEWRGLVELKEKACRLASFDWYQRVPGELEAAEEGKTEAAEGEGHGASA